MRRTKARPEMGRCRAAGWRLRRGALLKMLLLAASLAAQTPPEQANEIHMLVGRSVVLEHPADIVRLSVATPEVVDAVAVTTREVLLQGKSSGTTSVIVWAKGGDRQMFTVTVDVNPDPIQRQINATFAGEQIQVHGGRDTLTLTGKVSSAAVAERVAALAASGAKTVVANLEVAPAPPEKQILLRVRFAEVNRVALQQFGVSLLSTGALNTPGSLSTQQYGAPRPGNLTGMIGGKVTGTASDFTLGDVLNIFAFRPDLNLGVLIKALEVRNLLQILAQPNLVTSNGKEATFLAGGEFPFPVLQGGGNAGSVTVQFREFGVRVSFLPQLTAHHTIRMHVRPEVSSLDFANALLISGFTIPALSTRRVDSDVELELGQSFAIAGLFDQRVTEALQKIPGLASLPLLGNLFKSRSVNRSNSELLVVVTPEVLGPGVKVEPSPVTMDQEFLKGPAAPAGPRFEAEEKPARP
jgi:pilus assembly protein CpaC